VKKSLMIGLSQSARLQFLDMQCTQPPLQRSPAWLLTRRRG